jgi:hypothetical protein
VLTVELKKYNSKLRRAAGSGQPELGSGFRPLKTHNS